MPRRAEAVEGAVSPTSRTVERGAPIPTLTAHPPLRHNARVRVSTVARIPAIGGCDRSSSMRSRDTALASTRCASSRAAAWSAVAIGCERRLRRSPSQLANESTGPVSPNSSMVGERITAARTPAISKGTASATNGKRVRATGEGASGNRTSSGSTRADGSPGWTTRCPSPSGLAGATSRGVRRTCRRVRPTSTTSPTARGCVERSSRTPHTRVPFFPWRSVTLGPDDRVTSIRAWLRETPRSVNRTSASSDRPTIERPVGNAMRSPTSGPANTQSSHGEVTGRGSAQASTRTTAPSSSGGDPTIELSGTWRSSTNRFVAPRARRSSADGVRGGQSTIDLAVPGHGGCVPNRQLDAHEVLPGPITALHADTGGGLSTGR